MTISRGFRGRRPSVDPARVPRGQYVTDDFPVLSTGPTPRTPLQGWSFTIRGGSRGAHVLVYAHGMGAGPTCLGSSG